MTIDEAIKRYNHNAEHERTHGNLQGCLEFRQLAEWLNDYKGLKEQESILDKIRTEIGEVYEELDGYDPDSLGTFLSRIDDIFDKYKAESEG